MTLVSGTGALVTKSLVATDSTSCAPGTACVAPAGFVSPNSPTHHKASAVKLTADSLPAGETNWKVGVSPGTSPSITTLPNGGYEVAFQAAGGQLWSVGSGGWTNWNAGVAPGSSPSIASLVDGGFQIAFQAAGGQLWSVGRMGWTNWNAGVAPGTSPSIAGLADGGYEMAFQAAGGQLWTLGRMGWTNWNAGVDPGSSPAISALPGNGYRVAFQGAGGGLWTVGSTGWKSLGAILAPSSTPGIAANSSEGSPIALDGPDNQLLSISPSLGVRSGSTGVDISQYQCGDIPASRYPISVVQVSGGGINRSPNSCYSAEAAWAGPDLQTYIYMNGLPNPVPAEAANGPAGACGSNRLCLGYNFGWFWAQHWVSFAASAGPTPKQWWLDVETNSGWTDPGTDDQIIRGALDALHMHGFATGIYSNAHQWSTVTNGLVLPGTPVWVSGAGNLSGPGYTATNFCADPSQAFAGGVVRYVQYGYTGNFAGAWSGPASPYDLDYAC